MRDSTPPGLNAHPPFYRRRGALAALFVVAAGLRVFYALSAGYFVDEDTDWIWLAESISFVPGDLNLPLHYKHPALSSYFIKASGALFGRDIFGFRVLNLIAGFLTIPMAYALARKHFGESAGVWAAVLLTFNEFHIAMTSLALLDSFYFFFGLASVWFFIEYLCDQRPWTVYLSAFLLGLAFLCYEIASLVGLAYGIVLLLPRYHGRFRGRELYLATAIGVLTIAPDLYWGLGLAPGPDGALTYGRQLARAHGPGLNFTTFAFFFREPVRALLEAVGQTVVDPVAEYPAPNALLGTLMLVATGAVAVRRQSAHPARLVLITVFAAVVGALTLLRTGDPGPAVELTSWMWIDIVLFPAAILAGAWIADSHGTLRLVTTAVAVAGCMFSTFSLFRDQLGTPPASVFADPQNLWTADGRMAEVKVEISHCALCDPSSTQLAEVRTKSFETDVDGAEIGTDDRHLRLRAGTSSGDRQSYSLYYSVTDALGRRRVVRAQPVVVAAWVPWYKPPFWSNAARRD